MADTQYTRYYVAFLDILGFKNLVNDPNTSCQDILNTYEYVSYRHEKFFGDNSRHLHDSVKIKIMSDSICLYAEADIPNALFFLITYCVAFQHDLLVRNPSVLVRGGITMGDMYAKDDVIFGPALTQAYLLEENNAKVPRIIIRKSTIDYGMGMSDSQTQETINKWIFRDDDAFYAMNYFQILDLNNDKEAINHVKAEIAGKLDTTIDESIRQKYLYLEKNMKKYVSTYSEESANA